MSIQIINKSIKVIDEDILQVTKLFAENNLSKTCLKYADIVSDKHYSWTLEAGAYMVMFELPYVFQLNFIDISSRLNYFCSEYIEDEKLNSENLLSEFTKNYKKKLKFS